jgi:hypothetical protein
MAMTKREALAYARKRWGKYGDAIKDKERRNVLKSGPHAGEERVWQKPYIIGRWGDDASGMATVFGAMFYHYGSGYSWDEAVQSAEKYTSYSSCGTTLRDHFPARLASKK